MPGAFAHTDYALDLWLGLWNVRLTDDGAMNVGLYINDYTPIPGVQISDLTECNLSDYTRQNVGVAPWSQGVIDHVQILTAPGPVTFETEDADGQLCYGYFLFKDSEGELYWVQRFDAPQLLVDGVPLSFTPREKLRDCPDE